MTEKFQGFPKPKSNFSKLPHDFIDLLPVIDSMAELKVVIYILRHTWGYSEFETPKRITTDEFMNGRKKKDGTRIDQGTGLSNKSVITGLQKAVDHGFVFVDIDETDLARIEKSYSLNILDVKDLHSGMEDLHSSYEEITQRSEKETRKENNVTYDRKKGREEARKRKQAQQENRKGYLDYLLDQDTEEIEAIKAIRLRVETALHKNLEHYWDAARSDWNGYDKKLLEREKMTGQTIEDFMTWFNSNDFRRDNQRIWLKPAKIDEFWDEAFYQDNQDEEVMEYTRYDPEEEKRYGPSPAEKPAILRD